MTAEDIVWRLIERVWNAGDLAALEELFAEPFDQGGRRDTVAGVRAWHLDDAKTWADQRFEVVRDQ